MPEDQGTRDAALVKAKQLFDKLKGPGGWVAKRVMPRLSGYKQTDYLPTGNSLGVSEQEKLNELYRLNLARLLSNTVNIGSTAVGVGAIGSLLMNAGKIKDIASATMNPVPKNVKLVRRKKKKPPQEKQAADKDVGILDAFGEAIGTAGRWGADGVSRLVGSILSSRDANAAAATPTNLLDKGFGPLPAGTLPYLAIPAAALGGAAIGAKGTNDLLTGVRARQQAKRKKELQRQYALLMNLSPEELSAVRRLSKGEKRACDLSLAINEAVELSKTASVKGHVIGGLSLASLASLLLALKSGQHLREAVGHEKAKKEAVKSLLNAPPKSEPEKLPTEFFSGKSKRSPVKIVGPLGEEFDVAEPERESDYDPALDLLKAGADEGLMHKAYNGLKALNAAATPVPAVMPLVVNRIAANTPGAGWLGNKVNMAVKPLVNAGRDGMDMWRAFRDPTVREFVRNAPQHVAEVNNLKGQLGTWQGAFKTHFGFDPTNMTPEAINAEVKKLAQLKTQAEQTLGQAGGWMDKVKTYGPLFGLLGLAGFGGALMNRRQQPQQIVQQAPQQKAPWTEYV
jgi:hypothetical protein